MTQDTVVAVRRVPGSKTLTVGNVETEKYPTAELSADPSQEVPWQLVDSGPQAVACAA
jgi:hypothetical protein